MPTPILLLAENVQIPATLNDTVAAEDFKSRLPFIVSGHRSPLDYCCVAQAGKYDEQQTQSGWKNGDISLAGGWFAVLFDGEEISHIYHDMMIIAHIDAKHLPLVKDLPDEVTFVVDLAQSVN